MTPQAKWMLRRPLKRKPAHCKSRVEEFSLSDELLFVTALTKGWKHLSKWFPFVHHLTRPALSSQSFPGLFGGRRKFSICFHPSIPSDEDREWRRAQHHGCRAAAGLHDHGLMPSPSVSTPLCFWELDIFCSCTDSFRSHFSFFSSCERNCHHRRSSSLPPCSMNTVTVPPSTSSALTCDSSMGTAGSSFCLVRTLYFLFC